MLDSFLGYVFYAFLVFSHICISAPYIFHYIYNSKKHISEDLPHDPHIGTKEEDYDSLAPYNDSDEPVLSDRRRSRAYYRNKFWPSPRPVNFVRELMAMSYDIHVEGRLTHSKAIKILCDRAGLEESLFLKVDPINYSKLFMPSLFNYEKVLGSSVHALYREISRKGYMEELRAMG